MAETAADRILESELFLSGTTFTTSEMQIATGCSVGATRAALAMMKSNDMVTAVGQYGKFRKPQKHWLHQMRLANPVEVERKETGDE